MEVCRWRPSSASAIRRRNQSGYFLICFWIFFFIFGVRAHAFTDHLNTYSEWSPTESSGVLHRWTKNPLNPEVHVRPKEELNCDTVWKVLSIHVHAPPCSAASLHPPRAAAAAIFRNNVAVKESVRVNLKPWVHGNPCCARGIRFFWLISVCAFSSWAEVFRVSSPDPRWRCPCRLRSASRQTDGLETFAACHPSRLVAAVVALLSGPEAPFPRTSLPLYLQGCALWGARASLAAGGRKDRQTDWQLTPFFTPIRRHTPAGSYGNQTLVPLHAPPEKNGGVWERWGECEHLWFHQKPERIDAAASIACHHVTFAPTWCFSCNKTVLRRFQSLLWATQKSCAVQGAAAQCGTSVLQISLRKCSKEVLGNAALHFLHFLILTQLLDQLLMTSHARPGEKTVMLWTWWSGKKWDMKLRPALLMFHRSKLLIVCPRAHFCSQRGWGLMHQDRMGWMFDGNMCVRESPKWQ